MNKLNGRQCDTSFNKKLSKYAMKFWGNVRRQMCEQFYTLLSFLVVYLKILAQKPRQMLFRENRLETFFSDERVVCGQSIKNTQFSLISCGQRQTSPILYSQDINTKMHG